MFPSSLYDSYLAFNKIFVSVTFIDRMLFFSINLKNASIFDLMIKFVNVIFSTFLKFFFYCSLTKKCLFLGKASGDSEMTYKVQTLPALHRGFFHCVD